MRKSSFLVGLAAILLIAPVFAVGAQRPVLNQVVYRVTAEQWATTKTAKVIVTVNATLDKRGLASAHRRIMDNLEKISNKASWHITSFDRSKDQSGLERLFVSAQARLPESALSDLRSQAKSVSKPGTTYRVSSVQFTPSKDEIEQTRAALREKIYAKVKDDVARLDKLYPKQNYFVHRIRFGGVYARKPIPGARTLVLAKTPALSVSDKVTESAQVVLASKVTGS